MDGFYGISEKIEDWEKDDTELVKKVFKEQMIKRTTLTDAELEKMGLAQLGSGFICC
jgi:hypothetical protein